MIESYLCNPKQTFVYQVIYSIVIGIIFSCFSCSIAAILLFVILIEALIFSTSYLRYRLYFRIPIILSYFAGWIIGRTVFEQEYCYVSWAFDKKKGLCDANCCNKSN